MAGGVSHVSFTVTCPAPTGSIGGTISRDGAPVEGVVVQADRGGIAATTNAVGAYLLTPLPVGLVQVSLTDLSGECTSATQTTNVSAGAISTVDFVVSCPAVFVYADGGSDNNSGTKESPLPDY